MKTILRSLALILMGGVLAFPAVTLAAAPLFPGCDGTTTASAVCQDKDKPQTTGDNSFFGKNGILTKAARLVALGVGVASVIMIIIGGLKLVMASGDPSNVKGAKDTILYALVGLVVAAIAGTIIQFVVGNL